MPLVSSPGFHIEGVDKLFGFESIVEEYLSNLSLTTGNSDLDGTAVPSGKIWKITQAMIRYLGTVPTRVRIGAVGLAFALCVLDQASPASDQTYVWSGEIYLQESDFIRGSVFGATLNDDLYLRYAGIQMNAP